MGAAKHNLPKIILRKLAFLLLKYRTFDYVIFTQNDPFLILKQLHFCYSFKKTHTTHYE